MKWLSRLWPEKKPKKTAAEAEAEGWALLGKIDQAMQDAHDSMERTLEGYEKLRHGLDEDKEQIDDAKEMMNNLFRRMRELNDHSNGIQADSTMQKVTEVQQELTRFMKQTPYELLSPKLNFALFTLDGKVIKLLERHIEFTQQLREQGDATLEKMVSMNAYVSVAHASTAGTSRPLPAAKKIVLGAK